MDPAIAELARAWHSAENETEREAIILELAAAIKERDGPSLLSITEQIVTVLNRHRDDFPEPARSPPASEDASPVADVIGIFPSEAAIIRLPAPCCLSKTTGAVGRRYMSLETLAPFGHTEPVRLPAVAA
jgi:hypothetical protein